ncbi:MAG: DNA-3-methyladenine glycosylase [Bacteroidota bacterium]
MVSLSLPKPFRAAACLDYLGRSDKEILHRVDSSSVYKLLSIGQKLVLIRILLEDENLTIAPLNHAPSPSIQTYIERYVREWFDLDTELEEFYQSVSDDPVFNAILPPLHGLRLIKVPDLFESICWAIIGQQINLAFAYQIKQNLVLEYGTSLNYEGHSYHLFPKPSAIFQASDERLRELKCSRQKIRYLKIIAEAILEGALTKKSLHQSGYQEARQQLISFKGIGNWSANYVLMRCLGFKESFPIEDAGLHQALRLHYHLDHKPNMVEVRELTKEWTSWQAYRTFYLWQSLGLS